MGAKEVRPEVEIMLDKPRRLKLDLNAMVSFEKLSGKNILSLNFEGLSATDLRTLLWACLIHEDKALAPEDVGRIVDLSKLAEISAKISEAFANAMPESTGSPEKGDESPLVAKPPTG